MVLGREGGMEGGGGGGAINSFTYFVHRYFTSQACYTKNLNSGLVDYLCSPEEMVFGTHSNRGQCYMCTFLRHHSRHFQPQSLRRSQPRWRPRTAVRAMLRCRGKITSPSHNRARPQDRARRARPSDISRGDRGS